MARKSYISMAEMARRYGYTLNAIKGWKAEGLPYSDNPNGIPEIEGTHWIIDNKITPLRNTSVKEEMDLEKLREQKAKADLAQYAAQEKSRELIRADLVQQVLNEYCQKFKDSIRLIPSRYAVDILESAGSVQEIKQKLREILNDNLHEIGDLLIEGLDIPEEELQAESEDSNELPD
ncbi:hypothetical protein [Pantoea sp. MBLJ3]|uniref:hypothetical protein n=1 Tax=Pantoea sp. MBLJ3 TaxID=1562889 RepID=UPI0006906F0F|nr:hypothetical protein [Pantoea sp. MBLJ3]